MVFHTKLVLMTFTIESAPPVASKAIEGLAANAKVPSSYLRLCDGISWRSLKVRKSQTRTAPSWPPDTIKWG